MKKDEIFRILKMLVRPGSVAELRVIDVKDGNYCANYTGYFDNLAKMAEAAAKFDGKAPAVYFTLNECNPALLARASNRVVKVGKKSISTSDHDIIRLRWFPIDADAKRPAGISSSDEEHEAALWRASAIRDFLKKAGWPDPFYCDSGNGAHLLYQIDLENTPENVELVKSSIHAIAQRFDDDVIEIDKTVFNPSRIWKVYGTMACKGDATKERPHRKAEIIEAPATVQTVTVDRLKALAATAKPDKPAAKPTATTPTNSISGIDVEAFCRKHGLDIHHDAAWKDGKKYQVTPCPFNSDHSEAIIIKHPSGAVSFKCLHNGCVGKGWKQLRERFEPEALRQSAQPAPVSTTPKPKQRPTIEPRINIDSDLEAMLSEVEEQAAGRRVTIPLPWSRLSSGCNALRPGSMTVIAGPIKTGKSFFTMTIIKRVHEMGFDWAYLPLEDDRKAWGWRMLSILEQDYSINDATKESAEKRRIAVTERMEELSQYLARVTENPRVGIKDAFGNTVIPEISHDRVLGWIARAAKTARVIVVDPISQIEFNGREHWKDEGSFVRQALGIIGDTDASLILVAHTVKRSGVNASLDLTAEDVQGSAMYTRLAHTTLLLDACEMKDSEVARPQGGFESVLHNRVVTIAAARNGSASRSRLAFLQDKNKPHFEELGFLAPSKKRRK
ncbi:MAG TPA: AAA family ATPase [Candidatus Rifleibacterium sp.]|nr:AAA family ATPase [Candidatus Rifleibacterium sp.]